MISFLLVAGTLGYGVYLHRPLYCDGSFFIFYEITRESFMRPGGTLRFFTLLIEAPSLLVGLLTRDSESLLPIIRTAEISFTYYPLLSIIACAAFLWRKQKTEFILYPLAAFATGTMLTLPFAGGETPTVSAITWPLLFVMTLSDIGQRRTQIISFMLILALGVSHEGALLPLSLTGIFLGASAWRDLKHKPRVIKIALAILCFALAAWCVSRSVQYPTRGSFMNNLLNMHESYLVLTLCAAGMFAASLLISSLKMNRRLKSISTV